MDRCYVTEKIHGTSANISWSKSEGFKYFPGGIQPETFKAMIEERFPDIESRIDSLRDIKDFGQITFYGEAYGGKCQKMSDVYGPLNFIVFEVLIDDVWCDVPGACAKTMYVELPFVYWKEGPATVEFLNEERDRPSVQAQRNGMGDDKIGEGIVIRAIDEASRDRFGNRIIAKHKREEFRETKTVREVDPAKKLMFNKAKAVADEFVVMMRLQHVVDRLSATKPGFELSMKNTKTVIGAMIGDIRKEEGDTIEWSKTIQNAIGSRTAVLWREYLDKNLHDVKLGPASNELW